MNRIAIIFSVLFAGQAGAHPPEGQEMDAFGAASTLMSHGVRGGCFNPSLLRELSLEPGQSFMNPDLSEQGYTRCVQSLAIVIKVYKFQYSLRELINWE